MRASCEFCQILEGERDVHAVDKSEHAMAFLDENPAVEGHTLVIPATHHPELLSVNDVAVEAVVRMIRAVARAMETELDPDGFSVFYTTGSLVGNVEHAHVHLLPRYPDDGVELSLSRTRLDPENGEELAARLEV